MKLDIRLHRKILRWCEEYLPSKTSSFFHKEDILIKGYDKDLIFYNLDKLVKAEYIDGGYINATSYQVKDLTWKGHQYLNELRYPLLNFLKIIPRLIEFGLSLLPAIVEVFTLFPN